MYGFGAAGFGIGNPAAEFCVAHGGTLDGEICVLPGGRRCEQWAFYRGECPSASTTPKPLLPKIMFFGAAVALTYFLYRVVKGG